MKDGIVCRRLDCWRVGLKILTFGAVVKQLVGEIPVNQLTDALVPRPFELCSLVSVIFGLVQVDPLARPGHTAQETTRDGFMNHAGQGGQRLSSAWRALVVRFREVGVGQPGQNALEFDGPEIWRQIAQPGDC
jgi:hypothetical protein